MLSNVFMTFAWYGHLKGLNTKPLWIVVLISWGIAFFEYCFQVPGNRIGSELDGFSTGQLKVIQEIITLSVFLPFAVFYLREGRESGEPIPIARTARLFSKHQDCAARDAQ